MAKSRQSGPKKPSSPAVENRKEKSDINSNPPGNQGQFLTTNQGVRISDNHNSLKAGPRGPTLLEDFVLREKITHFDHERIPERVVHARGAGAFGVFECTEDFSKFTSAGFLTKKGKKTPVLVRFSTVAGSRGSADTARDARGFSTKFYTDEGNYDLVGNNIPVFFIHDAMKFPDLIHAVKPEPDLEIPQASSAHDTFWDFVSLMPESTHMLFWVMSDRAIPRSYRMMEGFGVHSFRFVNDAGKGSFVKFHWKPILGTHSVTWEESMNIMGQDSDFHRRDLYEAIESGAFPQWDFGVQVIPEADEFKYPFDLLDPTKIVPEELVPVQIIGRLTLNRNPDNFFAEIEQVAFHPGHMVPGIDVTNDPLLQGRLFSYTDTQLIRLGGPNFHELPVNRPLAPVHNNQRDGFGRQTIYPGKVSYEPNSVGGGCPFHSPEKMKSYVHLTERVDGHKVRARSTSFDDHFSQAKLFFNSQSATEQEHIKNAFIFELSKVEDEAIRERMVGTISQVDAKLASAIAAKVGVKVPARAPVQPNPADPENNIIPPNRSLKMGLSDEPDFPKSKVSLPASSPALSMLKNVRPSIKTRKIAVLVAEGVSSGALQTVLSAFKGEGAVPELVAPQLGVIPGTTLKIDKTFDNTTALHYDAVWVADGAKLADSGPTRKFILQAYKHCKTIGGAGTGAAIGRKAVESQREFQLGKDDTSGAGVCFGKEAKSSLKEFIASAKMHRVWEREPAMKNLAV